MKHCTLAVRTMEVDISSSHAAAPQLPTSSTMQDNPSSALRDLAVRLYNARQEGDSDSEQANLLSSALQHFAHARQMARKVALENRHDRQQVAETRSRMDAAFLAQQNRNYEIGYLYREIEKCNDYEWVGNGLLGSSPADRMYVQLHLPGPSDRGGRRVAAATARSAIRIRRTGLSEDPL